MDFCFSHPPSFAGLIAESTATVGLLGKLVSALQGTVREQERYITHCHRIAIILDAQPAYNPKVRGAENAPFRQDFDSATTDDAAAAGGYQGDVDERCSHSAPGGEIRGMGLRVGVGIEYADVSAAVVAAATSRRQYLTGRRKLDR